MIAGFPGESEEQFEELCEFVKQTKFNRLGCFAYSQEEDTVAGEMPNQIDEEIRAKRAEIIMQEQTVIMQRDNENKLGKTIKVVLEGADKYAGCYFGRSEADAPDIDGKVFFTTDKQHTMGDFINVKVTEILDYDLFGEEI